ncbi:MAG TPA: hypothetical protein VFZ53_22855 [Polyangiaceae bacterium]
MNAWLNYVGCGLIALSAFACGSKGEDDGGDEETGGTSGSSSGGSSTGGTSSGGTNSGGTSSGGSAGSGTGGSGTLPPSTTISFDEATDVCPDPLTDPNVANCWKLVDSNAMDPTMAIPDADIHWEHNADDGDPDPGAFQATIPYDQASQWVSFGVNFNTVDMTSRVISARVKIVSGFDGDLATAQAGMKVYAKSGMGYCYANGAYFNLAAVDQWTTIEFDLTQEPGYRDPMCADPFDPSDIREIGVQFDSSMAAMSPETAVVLIDNVQY